MNAYQNQEVIQLLQDWQNGDQAALDQLMPLVYAELHRLASRHMAGERQGHTLQTTDLVNEAFLRLVGQPPLDCQDRVHFMAISARIMRNILVDYARARYSARRGGKVVKVPLEEAAEVSVDRAEEMVALDDALDEMAKFDERRSRIIELRFFAGLSVEETAQVLGVSPGTVLREWSLAKAWLQLQISGE